jgi:peptidyl-Lys metalloendopeptidase
MTRRTLFGTLAALGCVLAALFPAQAASTVPQLQSTLAIEKAGEEALTTAREVLVRFDLKNAGTRSASLLRWETPLFGVNDDLFEVTRDGAPVAYLGRHVRRPAPQRADYLVVLPGETLSAVVPLSSLYDLSRPGDYSVRYRVQAVNPSARGAADAMIDVAASGLLSFSLGGDDVSAQLAEMRRASRAAVEPEMDASYVGPGFVGCSTSRQNTIRSAMAGAQGQTSNSLAYLNSGQRGSRYTTWFGTYSSSRYTAVRRKIAAMDAAIRNQRMVFDCRCTESWYAYVYSDSPYDIYLCNAFWPASNADKYGTITHEVSHFNVVAGSEDIAYGVSACQSLARSSPSRATRNADSLAYFGY